MVIFGDAGRDNQGSAVRLGEGGITAVLKEGHRSKQKR